jgi:hypothetical protein
MSTRFMGLAFQTFRQETIGDPVVDDSFLRDPGGRIFEHVQYSHPAGQYKAIGQLIFLKKGLWL